MAGSMKTRAEVFRLSSEVSSPRVHSLAGSRARIAPVPSAYAHSPSAPPPLHRRNSESDVASTSSRLGRVSTDNSRGLEAGTSAASQAPSTSLQWHSRLHLESEGVEQFTLNSSGEFFLVRKTEQSRQKHNIVSHGSITLPVGVGPETFQVERQVFDGRHLVEAHATWGPATAPVARLSVCSAKIASSRYDWCKVRPLDKVYPHLHLICKQSTSTHAGCPCCWHLRNLAAPCHIYHDGPNLMLQGQDIYNNQDASSITVWRHAKKLTNPPAS